MSVIPNVLAERYASAAMKSIWSAEGRIILEREFWIAVMKAQKDLGLDIPDGVIEAYERVKDQVNLPSIDARERVTRHDVKARIEEFCELAGCEHIHKGMTSRDLTENVEQLQIWKSMQIIRDKAVAVLNRMSALGRTMEARDHCRTHAQCSRTDYDHGQTRRHVRGRHRARPGDMDFPHGPLQRTRAEGRRWNPA